jgi:uncharacterized membrane protein
MDFLALGLATQAIVAALGGATTLAVNVILAKWWHNEELNQIDLIGVCLIIAGAVGIAFGSPAAEEYTLDDLLELAFRCAARL